MPLRCIRTRVQRDSGGTPTPPPASVAPVTRIWPSWSSATSAGANVADWLPGTVAARPPRSTPAVPKAGSSAPAAVTRATYPSFPTGPVMVSAPVASAVTATAWSAPAEPLASIRSRPAEAKLESSAPFACRRATAVSEAALPSTPAEPTTAIEPLESTSRSRAADGVVPKVTRAIPLAPNVRSRPDAVSRSTVKAAPPPASVITATSVLPSGSAHAAHGRA